MREWARILRHGPIALDATYSVGQHLSGVGVYSREILYGLAERNRAQKFLSCYRPHRFFRSFSGQTLPPNVSRALLRHGGIAPWRCSLFHALNQRVDRKFAPTVTTFHDLFVITGEYSTPDFRRRFTEQATEAAAASDMIIAVSEFTASQVVSLLGVPPSRVRVIPHGVRPPAATPPDDAVRENLILNVGAIQKRKNTARLIEAFEEVEKGWRLILAGDPGGFGADEILARVERSHRRADIDVAGYVDSETLEGLYRRARVFAFPSLDEGFGMPVLDAMARGVPVLTSNRSALPEVAGHAGLLVCPDSTDDITAGLARLTSDGGLRETLRQHGFARAAEFNWQRSVEMTWMVYNEVADFRF